jgi:RNA exonuclease 1
MISSALDIAALDCEMVYTTGGFRIARVSVVDASGECVFDEFIKMDDGVKVVCVHLSFPPHKRNSGYYSRGSATPEQGFEHAFLRHPFGRVRSARSTTFGVGTARVGTAHWRRYDSNRACARQ